MAAQAAVEGRELWTPEPAWRGATAFLLGGGPSLAGFDVGALSAQGRLLAINSSLDLAPFADALFFTDNSWFERNRAAVEAFGGPAVTASRHAKAALPSLKRVALLAGAPLGAGQAPLRCGACSGQTAIALAAALGAARIVLLGYDMRLVQGRSHHHDAYRHQDGRLLERDFLPAFAGWRAAADAAGIAVVNATPGSALEEFPYEPLLAPVARRWAGKTVGIVASGPSLTEADCARLRERVDHTIAVNDSWTRAPWAELLYAADRPWWDHEEGALHRGFAGEKWTGDLVKSQDRDGLKAARRWRLRCVPLEHGAPLSLDPALLRSGWNSGFAALNLAALFGARRILLLGFDCAPRDGRSHWFGNHPRALNQILDFDLWRQAFESAAPLLAAAGVEVVNCSRETALTCFRRAQLGEARAVA